MLKGSNIRLAKRAIAEVAEQEGKTVGEIRTAMQEAIMEGFSNPDPAIRTKWAMIPRKGHIPTPEEVILRIAARIQ